MKHKKKYESWGGVSVYCGRKLVSYKMAAGSNFFLNPCPYCGDYIATTGGTPETDKIKQWEY